MLRPRATDSHVIAQTTNIATQPLLATAQTKSLFVTDTFSVVGIKGAQHHLSVFTYPLSFRGVDICFFPFHNLRTYHHLGSDVTTIAAMSAELVWTRQPFSCGDYKDTLLYMPCDILSSKTPNSLYYSVYPNSFKVVRITLH